MISSNDDMATRFGSANCEVPDWLPVAAGAAVALLALSKRSKLLGIAMLAGGGYLTYRAAQQGLLRIPPDLMDRLRSQAGLSMGPARRVSPAGPQDVVDEASMESFPASDPPACY